MPTGTRASEVGDDDAGPDTIAAVAVIEACRLPVLGVTGHVEHSGHEPKRHDVDVLVLVVLDRKLAASPLPADSDSLTTSLKRLSDLRVGDHTADPGAH